MKKLEIITRPEKLEEVKEVMDKSGHIRDDRKHGIGLWTSEGKKRDLQRNGVQYKPSS